MPVATDETNGPALTPEPGDMTHAVQAARRGFRRDVQTLVDALDAGELFVPLAASIPNAEYGERVAFGEELSLTPHLLVDADGKLYCALFTRPEIMEPLGESLGWTTDGAPLEYCAVPARVALDMVLSVIDDDKVLGLVVNAAHDSELFLRREELGNIAKNRAIPLVGYVQEIPEQSFEQSKTLVAADDPPPAELVAALDDCVRAIPELAGYALSRTFNPERDVEPHLTLSLRTKSASSDLGSIAKAVVARIEGQLPPPGYIDVLFEEPAN